MASEYKVAQYKYYNCNNNTGGYNKWLEGLFPNYSVKKLGIQTLPGITFSINGIGNLIINHTGIYEIDLRNTTTSINTLQFTGDSLIRIEEVPTASIIVDILYNEG